MLPIAIWTCLISGAIGAAGVPTWDYSNGPLGPANWATNFPQCGGAKQSPVQINTTGAILNSYSCPFRSTNYNTENGISLTLRHTLFNNGHTVLIAVNGSVCLEAGGLPERYCLGQIHFHWGSNNATGSEHIFDGEAAPMEVHFVNYGESWGSIEQAMDKSQGLAVVAFLYKLDSSNNTHYEEIVNNLKYVRHVGDEKELHTFRINELFPLQSETVLESTYEYYRYEGSLTTPPCYESVIWSVFSEPIEISFLQLQEFRMLLDTHNNSLVDNFRPTQPLNNRRIFKNTRID